VAQQAGKQGLARGIAISLLGAAVHFSLGSKAQQQKSLNWDLRKLVLKPSFSQYFARSLVNTFNIFLLSLYIACRLL